MKPRSFIAFSACWILLQAISGCEPERENVSTDEKETASILRRGNGDDPASLDPARAEEVHTFNVLVNIFEGLVADAADGSLIPGVAESWEIGGDGLVYRFHLCSNARWSINDPVCAANFVNAFRRVAAPDSQSSYGFLLEPIENFVDVRKGQKSGQALGVNAIDDRTPEIRLSTPSSHMLAVLAMPIAFPVHGSNPSTARFLSFLSFLPRVDFE